MFGFFTFVAFIVAWIGGGWLWLIAIVMGLVWFGKQQQKNEKAASTSLTSVTQHETQKGDAREQSEQLGKVNDWVIKLTETCARYSGPGYYVAELIPKKKLENAMKSYPVPNGGRVIALVDATVMGSADEGMAIGEYGISWHNDWSTDSKKTSLRWSEMKNLSIEKAGRFDIGIGDDNKFSTSGCQFSKDNIVNLLRELQAISISFIEDEVRHPANASTKAKGVVDVNSADFDQLLSLPGIGAAEARMIIDRRSSGVFFVSLDEMVEFLDLKPHKAEQLRNIVIFSEPGSLPPAATPKNPSPPQTNSPKQPYVPAPSTPAPSQSGPGRVID